MKKRDTAIKSHARDILVQVLVLNRFLSSGLFVRMITTALHSYGNPFRLHSFCRSLLSMSGPASNRLFRNQQNSAKRKERKNWEKTFVASNRFKARNFISESSAKSFVILTYRPSYHVLIPFHCPQDGEKGKAVSCKQSGPAPPNRILIHTQCDVIKVLKYYSVFLDRVCVCRRPNTERMREK